MFKFFGEGMKGGVGLVGGESIINGGFPLVVQVDVFDLECDEVFEKFSS